MPATPTTRAAARKRRWRGPARKTGQRPGDGGADLHEIVRRPAGKQNLHRAGLDDGEPLRINRAEQVGEGRDARQAQPSRQTRAARHHPPPARLPQRQPDKSDRDARQRHQRMQDGGQERQGRSAQGPGGKLRQPHDEGFGEQPRRHIGFAIGETTGIHGQHADHDRHRQPQGARPDQPARQKEQAPQPQHLAQDRQNDAGGANSKRRQKRQIELGEDREVALRTELEIQVFGEGCG